MDIRQLLYFVTVVREKTVTAAAKELNMTQPPLTSQLHLLEGELGCRLFRRAGRRLYLTEAGQRFYGLACQILGMCETAKQEMSDFREGSAGTLRIGVVSSVRGSLFINLVKDFHSAYPNIRLSIHSANTYELLDALHNREIDLALVRTPFSSMDLDILYMQREKILAVGLPSYFKTQLASPLTLRNLSSMPLIIYRRWQKVIEASFEAAGLIPSIFCVNDDASMTLLLASQGLGVGLLHPSAMPREPVEGVVCLSLEEASLVSQIALVCQSRQQLPQTALRFWDMVQAAYPQG